MFRDAAFDASEQSLFSSPTALSAFARAAAGEDVPEAGSAASAAAAAAANTTTAAAAATTSDEAGVDGVGHRAGRWGVDAAGFRWARPTDPFPTAESKSDGGRDGGDGGEGGEGGERGGRLPALVNPGLFIDGDDAGDVVCQASFLNDAWFLGALGAIAAHPLALVQNLFVEEDDGALLERGFVTCRFYMEGEWQEVKVDSRLPLREDSESGPGVSHVAAYGRCKNPEEQWVQLVEKAYAKLCGGNYACLDGGSVADALTDLTGGSSQTILFTTPQVADMIERSALWGRVQKYLEWFYVLACAKTAGVGTRDGPAAGSRDEHSGLLHDRAYSILTAKEVGALRFVKVRNPWGAGGDWRGDWSDESPKWDEHPEVEQAMKEDDSIGFDRLSRDGTFWMVWEVSVCLSL